MHIFTWYQWLTLFYIYSFLGWCFESTYVSLKSGCFVNRGFLRSCMLPLYGTGAVMMLFVSLPVRDNLFLVYISGVIAATILEYITGYVMERLFKVKYWDYSYQKFNLNGYICLSSSIAWGFLTLLLTEIIDKPISRFVLSMNPVMNLTLTACISAVFVVDLVQSTRTALDLGRMLEAIQKLHGDIEDLQVQLNLLKEETASKLVEMKEATEMKMALAKAETAARLDAAKATTAERLEARKLAAVEHLETAKISTVMKFDELQTQIQQLKTQHQEMIDKINISKKALLRNNPGATSHRFAQALKEIKERL